MYEWESVRAERGAHRRLLFGTEGPTLGRGMIPTRVKCHVPLPEYAPWDDFKWGWALRPKRTVAQRRLAGGL